MDKKINLSQLADLLSQAGGMSKAASEQFVKSFFDIISQSVLEDGIVKVKGLGTFKLMQMEDRESVNVNTGERFTIEGHQKISFVPDAELKDRINKPFAAFETVEISEEQAAELSKIEEEQEEADSEPKVKEVTQKRFTRFILKFLLWISIIIVVLGLALYLLWPVVGCKVLSFFDNHGQKAQTTDVASPDAEKAVPTKEVKPEEIAQPAKEETKPAAEPAKPATTIKPAATKPATTTKPASTTATKPRETTQISQVFTLNKQDEAKDLSCYTAADTVNYRIVGQLTVHTMQKGETLTKIALQYYGSKKLWPYIAKYNGFSSFNDMKPGTIVKVPRLGNK